LNARYLERFGHNVQAAAFDLPLTVAVGLPAMGHRAQVMNDGGIEGDLEAVVRWVREAGHVVALTGAGISTESGIPDFRSPDGLWANYPPMEYATLSCFINDPEKSWRMFRALASSLDGKQPNPAHLALAELEAAGRLQAVVTQNIDSLHTAAGSRRVLEIHGHGNELHCVRCGHREPFLDEHLAGSVPSCPACGQPLKPDAVLFEEPVRRMTEIDAEIAACDCLLAVGTSGEVWPASQFAGDVQRHGGAVIEFNLQSTTLTATLGERSALVEGPAGRSVPAVVAAVLAETRRAGR